MMRQLKMERVTVNEKEWIERWRARAEETGSVNSPDTKVMIGGDRQ